MHLKKKADYTLYDDFEKKNYELRDKVLRMEEKLENISELLLQMSDKITVMAGTLKKIFPG